MSAPATFQNLDREDFLNYKDIPKWFVFDSVLLTGKDDADHLVMLAFDQLYKWGLRLKKAKCKFMKQSLQYLGYIMDAQGLHTSPDNIKAIKEATQPNNQQQLRVF